MQVRARALLLVTALSLVFGARVAAADPPPPIRISPLGDSITSGVYVEGGYRLPLYQLLSDAGYNVDFVGTQQTNPSEDLPDPDHDGYVGWRIKELDGIVDPIYDSIANPDVILLMIGINDFYQLYKTNAAHERLDLLVEHLATKRPSTKIIVASLLETSNSGVNSGVDTMFNPYIPIICSNHFARGQQVYFTDMRAALTVADTADGLHPNEDGYRKMATNWFAMITNAFSPLGSTNPPAIFQATGLTNWTNIVVEFSKPVADNATNASSYSLSDGLSILGATLDLEERRVVTLLTPPFAPNSPYVLMVSDVQDFTAEANPIAPGSTFAFMMPALSGDCPGNSATSLADQVACVGGTVVFSTSAGGPGPITYAWSKDGVELPDETNGVLVVSNVVESGAGNYCVIVSGACGSVTNCAMLSLWTNTTAAGPSDVAVCPGGNAMLCTVASGTGPFSYQWCRGTMPLDGQTNDCLTLTNLLVEDAGSYCVKVTGLCNTVTNCALVLVVTNIVASGPGDQTVCRGSAVTFCTVADGPGPFGYVWSKDGVIISDATNSCLTLSNVRPSDAGLYCVEIAWACLRLTNCATIKVVHETSATPLSGVSNICPGETVTFATAVSGKGPFSYQWSKDGAELASATNNSFTINSASPIDSGNYCVKVSGACNSVTNCASLDVNVPITLVGAETLTNCVGSATLEVTALGTGPHAYQWSKERVEIPGATNSTYQIASVSSADAGNYCVAVRGPCNSVTHCATLWLAQQTRAAGPSDARACAGTDVTLCTVALGTGPFRYQWRKDEMLLAGETNDCLTLHNISPDDAGSYCVQVNGTCNAVTNCATLLLWTNTAAAGPSDATVCPGENVMLCAVSSGTGPFNYQWCRGATPLEGETNDCLTLTNLSVEDSDSYCVKVTGLCNSVTNCALVAVVTNVIASGPADQTACPGSAVTFCTVPLGPGPFAYVWSKDGAIISDATNSCLTVSNVSAADAGVYCVEIARACLRLTNCATLSVLPETQASPVASVSNVCVGDSVTLNTAAAAGVGPFACKWSKAGVEIGDATNSWYTISSVSANDSGAYCVVVSGSCGSVTNCASLSLASVSVGGAQMTNGDFSLTFAGPDGFAYELRATEDVTLPLSQWEVVTNGVFNAQPEIFVEPAATNRFLRFFQVISRCPGSDSK